MSPKPTKSGSELFIVDNSDEETIKAELQEVTSP